MFDQEQLANEETLSLFSFKKTEILISLLVAVLVLVLFLVLGQLKRSFALFFEPQCEMTNAWVFSMVASGAVLLIAFWATIGTVRYLGDEFRRVGEWGSIARSTYLTFALPILTIFATLINPLGFILVGVIAAVLLVTSFSTDRYTATASAIVWFANAVISLVALALAAGLLLHNFFICVLG